MLDIYKRLLYCITPIEPSRDDVTHDQVQPIYKYTMQITLCVNES